MFSVTAKEFIVKTLGGRTLLATLIQEGDEYGRTAVWHYDEPGVEFHDITDLDEKQVTGGQYFLSTLLKKSQGGLCINGGVPAWNIGAEEFAKLRKWLEEKSKA